MCLKLSKWPKHLISTYHENVHFEIAEKRRKASGATWRIKLELKETMESFVKLNCRINSMKISQNAPVWKIDYLKLHENCRNIVPILVSCCK